MESSKKLNNFKRISEKRKNEIISKIYSLLNLNNKSFYAYEKKDLKELFNEIENALNETKSSLLKGGKYKNNFSLNNDNEISITLPLEIWEEIASACISVADYHILNDNIIESLRKTYFQIKKETR